MESAKSRYTPFFSGPTPLALVDDDLGVAGRDVAGHQVAERRVLALEVVVAVLFGDLVGGAGLVGVLRDPDAAVVAQRLRHEGELRLELVARRDAGRVDLRVAGVGEGGALLVGPPRRGDVAVLGVGRQVEGVAVPAGAEQDGVARPALDLAGERSRVTMPTATPSLVTTSSISVWVCSSTRAERHLLHERLVGAEQQLLAGLAPGVERAGDLGAAEGAVVEQAAVLAGEGHALGDALVDDVDRHLGQAVDVAPRGPGSRRP